MSIDILCWINTCEVIITLIYIFEGWFRFSYIHQIDWKCKFLWNILCRIIISRDKDDLILKRKEINVGFPCREFMITFLIKKSLPTGCYLKVLKNIFIYDDSVIDQMKFIFNVSSWQECIFADPLCDLNFVGLIEKLWEIGFRDCLFVSRKLKIHRATGWFCVTSEVVCKGVVFSFETRECSIFSLCFLDLILYLSKLACSILMYIFRIVS